MNIATVIALLASTLSTLTSAGEVWEMQKDDYVCLGAVSSMLNAADEETHHEEDVFGCETETMALLNCFTSIKETDGEGCWNCVMDETQFEDCEEYCMHTEQCRSNTCSHKYACVSQYYDTLNCVLLSDGESHGCYCDSSASGHGVVKTSLRA
mmetsp:Transcript_14261/g.25794  ORF Transcript_14261/g.25794 Transcript_14261/m.25794 type:complete len:153 (-) Transcript_14261:96-554(-)|eukprot:CAMPEP_0201600138 /NCGR_PEP_ID=MMETSP0492-20130828/1329_1 /ASSEMBLY_ACC=CAM_ASM_000837 /TAXON_ID=420259 /ORGANISM="Thalassiosira gravida, Strain GMp14c1" /LENGTH=152 /DNA_ID=CAMNT_0048062849 /DNA_START=161 /DNA_END=619 /DNA_ORIENTATION=-